MIGEGERAREERRLCECWEGFVMRLLVILVCSAGRKGRGRIMGMLCSAGLLVGVEMERQEERRLDGTIVCIEVIEDWRLRGRVGEVEKRGNDGVEGVVGVSIGDVRSCILVDVSGSALGFCDCWADFFCCLSV
jgi:hypothetical protein